MRPRDLGFSFLVGFTFFAALAGLNTHRPRAETPIAPAAAAGQVQIHYAPAENLEKIDVAQIDNAVETIDIAAFVLSDHALIDALVRAAGRGVAVRILLDRGQYESQVEHLQGDAVDALRATADVRSRIKTGHVLMHLKSYQIDGRVLRTGSANFSASGLKQQDNDLVLITSRAAAAAFRKSFDAMFEAGGKE